MMEFDCDSATATQQALQDSPCIQVLELKPATQQEIAIESHVLEHTLQHYVGETWEVHF